MLQNVLTKNRAFIFWIHVMIWLGLSMSSVAMVGKNMDSEPGSTMLSVEGEKDLIVQGLVQYYVNLGYMKFVEQFVTP